MYQELRVRRVVADSLGVGLEELLRDVSLRDDLYALGKIAGQDAALADHLRRSARTGYFCAYDPSAADPIVWDV
jgi:hypothetical protein